MVTETVKTRKEIARSEQPYAFAHFEWFYLCEQQPGGVLIVKLFDSAALASKLCRPEKLRGEVLTCEIPDRARPEKASKSG